MLHKETNLFIKEDLAYDYRELYLIDDYSSCIEFLIREIKEVCE
jgi:hypothetical protein